MSVLIKMSVTEFKLYLRNFIYVFFAFGFPPLMLLLMGSMFGNQPTDFYQGYGAVNVMTPCYMGMVLAVCGIMGLPLQLAEYRQRKVLKRFKATPLGTPMIMLPQLIVNFILCVIGIILLILVGKLVFDLQFLGHPVFFAFALLLSIVSMFSIGFLIAAVAPGSKAATAIAYLVYFPMLFLSGATMPMEMMPDAIVNVSKVLPLTHSVDLLKRTWIGDTGHLLTPIIVLSAVTLVCIFVSVRLFRWE